MAKRTFLGSIDLTKNQLLQAALQNLATHPATPAVGQIYWNTTDVTAYIWDGGVWRDLLSGSAYTHPTFSGNDLGAALTGATVISDVDVNTEGHVTGFATRDLTPADIGAAVINDAATNTTDTWSSSKIDSEIAAAVSGGMTFMGAYNASTNTPDLDGAPAAGTISQGDVYVVSVDGTFYSENVQVGDTLYAKIDNPASLADWVTVNKNIPDIVPASETAQGIIEIATQAEVDAGTDDLRAVTPLKLEQRLQALPVGIGKSAVTIGDGVATSIVVAHNMNTRDVHTYLYEAATPFAQVEAEVVHTDLNNVTFNFNAAPTSGQYRAVIIG